MTLEWGVMSVTVAAEVFLLLLVTLPGTQRFRKSLISISKSALQPMFSVVPFAFFLLMDIYWKYEHSSECQGPLCTEVDVDRHHKSVYRRQRDVMLAVGAVVLYWLLFRVTLLLISLEKLGLQLKKLKESAKPVDS